MDRHTRRQLLHSRVALRKLTRGRRGLRRKPPKPRHPTELQRRYLAAMQPMLQAMHKLVQARLMPRLGGILERARRVRGDDLSVSLVDDIQSVFGEIRLAFGRAWTDKDVGQVALTAARSVDKFSADYIRGAVQAVLGVDPLLNEPWLADMIDSFVKDNVSLITSVPDRYFDELESLVTRAVRTGASTDDVAADIEDRFDVGESRAAFIARDQISKFNGDLSKARQKDLGIDGYFWRGSLDARERDSHRAHEGRRYEWNSPPADTGHPGEDYQCRCVAEPDLSGLLDTAGE